MKLRIKDTGEIDDFSIDTDDEGRTVVQRVHSKKIPCEYVWYFDSLEELNETFEDYTPQEPLIKDEKIRKALWVWADENRIKKVGFKLDKGNTLCACYFYDESCEVCEFGLKFYLPIDADKIYTITELCGEEE